RDGDLVVIDDPAAQPTDDVCVTAGIAAKGMANVDAPSAVLLLPPPPHELGCHVVQPIDHLLVGLGGVVATVANVPRPVLTPPRTHAGEERLGDLLLVAFEG